MSEPTFEIVFRGKLLREFDRAVVVQNLMNLFRIDAARVEAMLGQSKLVLKRGLSKDAAQRYQEVLRQAGIMVAAISEAPTASVADRAAPSATAATTPPAAPAAATASVPPGPAAVAATSAPASAAPPDARFSLAPVGAVIVEAQRPVAREFNLSGLTLDAPGTILASPTRSAPVRRFDASGLSLAPVSVEDAGEREPSSLDRALYSSS